MRRTIIIRYVALTICLVLLLALAACGQKTPAPPEGTSGDELIAKMEDSVKSLNSAHLTMVFQVGSVEGPVNGTLELWGERPNKIRAEITSELGSLDRIQVIGDGSQFWAYSPREQLAVVSDKNQYGTLLRSQPELRDIDEFGQKIIDRGFDGTQAENLGSEEINGRNTYKVQVKYDDPDLQGVTATFWIDETTYLPQRVEVVVEREGFTLSGFAEVQGEIEANADIDPAQFSFTPPEGVSVLNLSDLPGLPQLSDLPKIE
jgi:outer membrane lipoprotein-sorting protein